MADLAYVQEVLQKVERELERTPDSASEYLATLMRVKRRGLALLSIQDPHEFDFEASEFLRNVEVLLPNL